MNACKTIEADHLLSLSTCFHVEVAHKHWCTRSKHAIVIAYVRLPNMLVYQNISCSVQFRQQVFMQIGLLPQEINIPVPSLPAES